MSKMALSFSRVDAYLQCPLQFEAKFITKTYPDENNSPALVKGKEIHSQLENWMKASLVGKDVPNLSVHAANAVPIMTNILENYTSISPENQLAIDESWSVCDWFASNVYYRAVVDLMAFKGDTEAIVVDYKTGKVRGYEAGKHAQLNLTAAMLFSIYPQLETIKCYYLFVEHKQTSSAKFYRHELEELKRPFVDIHNEINTCTDFKPKTNQYCRWCKVPSCVYKK